MEFIIDIKIKVLQSRKSDLTSYVLIVVKDQRTEFSMELRSICPLEKAQQSVLQQGSLLSRSPGIFWECD